MTNEDLLEKYPKVAKIIKAYFTEKMLESLDNEAVPDDFKQYMREKGVEDGMLINMININPHGLFAIFDANDIYISIKTRGEIRYANKWEYTIDSVETIYDPLDVFPSRNKCENAAIEKAFDILNETL